MLTRLIKGPSEKLCGDLDADGLLGAPWGKKKG